MTKTHLTPVKNNLIKLPRVRERVSMSGSLIYSLVSQGKFPKPIKISEGGRASAWVESEIDQWISDRISDSRSEQP